MKFRELLISTSKYLHKIYSKIFLKYQHSYQQPQMKLWRAIFLHSEYSTERLGSIILTILESSPLCSLATVGSQGESHINAAFFCFDDNLKIYFLSDADTKHCQNIKLNKTAAMTVFDTNQIWGTSLRGMQLFGECKLIDGDEENLASSLYGMRFPAYGAYRLTQSPEQLDSSNYKFFLFFPTTLKIIDEDEFGDETYVTVELERRLDTF